MEFIDKDIKKRIMKISNKEKNKTSRIKPDIIRIISIRFYGEISENIKRSLKKYMLISTQFLE